MICFRSYISWYLQQLKPARCGHTERCDLLSFLHFVIFATVEITFCGNAGALWFAFVLTFRDICNSVFWTGRKGFAVVICFRSYISWYLQQFPYGGSETRSGCDLLSFLHFVIFATVERAGYAYYDSCDLLSFLHFVIFATVYMAATPADGPLWFAFVLTFRDICNSIWPGISLRCIVVICFRSYISWYLQQLL